MFFRQNVIKLAHLKELESKPADGFSISNVTNSPDWMDFSHCLAIGGHSEPRLVL